ncbi:MAG: hypothetical protein NTY33_01665 [Candidatus Moranbacteria bacterium]|nr:hypothetical protein [Candidatus Moranbacteria bacterium]
MASQIAHIVYAKKYFDQIENGKTNDDFLDEEKIKHNRKINKDEFMLGTTFPDIRRIEPSIKRKDTHLQFEPLNLDFSGLTSFEAGWKFHLYCDMRRDEILNAHGFFKLAKTAELFGHPAKFIEDELLYDHYNNWEKVANYFRNPPLVNLDIKADRPTFVLWYAILANYMEKKPDEKTIRIFLSKKSSLSQKTDEIIEIISELKKNKKVVDILEHVLDEIV